jgi:hypothetical protein
LISFAPFTDWLCGRTDHVAPCAFGAKDHETFSDSIFHFACTGLFERATEPSGSGKQPKQRQCWQRCLKKAEPRHELAARMGPAHFAPCLADAIPVARRMLQNKGVRFI